MAGGFDQNSKVASHVHHFNHNMNFENVKVVERLLQDKIKLATNLAHLHLYLSIISISISLKTRIAEHKKAVAGGFDQNSKVASHVHHFNHNMNFENVKVVERLFLEVSHSTLDPSAGNHYIVFSEVRQRYRASMNYMVTRASFAIRYFR